VAARVTHAQSEQRTELTTHLNILPVDLSEKWSVPPEAARMGLQGRPRTHEKRHRVEPYPAHRVTATFGKQTLQLAAQAYVRRTGASSSGRRATTLQVGPVITRKAVCLAARGGLTSDSCHSRIFRLMSSMKEPRLDTFCLNLSLPREPHKGVKRIRRVSLVQVHGHRACSHGRARHAGETLWIVHNTGEQHGVPREVQQGDMVSDACATDL